MGDGLRKSGDHHRRTGGIGAATAKCFIREGAQVVLASRRERKLEELRQTLEGLEQAVAIPTGVTYQERFVALLEQTQQHFGAIHILVNNATCSFPGNLDQLPVDALEKMIDVNLKALLMFMPTCFTLQENQKKWMWQM